jgi:hypothetical protein
MSPESDWFFYRCQACDAVLRLLPRPADRDDLACLVDHLRCGWCGAGQEQLVLVATAGPDAVTAPHVPLLTPARKPDPMHLTLRSGRAHSLVDPVPETITAEDVACGLSRLCRFSGHCAEFYSVAQHSVLVGWLVQCRLWDPIAAACPLVREDVRRMVLAALLHDAHETLWGLGDLARPALQAAPLHVRLFVEQQRTRHDQAVAAAFRIPVALFAHPEIRRADDEALSWELRDVVEPGRPGEGLLPVPTDLRLVPLGEWDARHLWLRTLRNLSAGDPIPRPHFLWDRSAWPVPAATSPASSAAPSAPGSSKPSSPPDTASSASAAPSATPSPRCAPTV